MDDWDDDDRPDDEWADDEWADDEWPDDADDDAETAVVTCPSCGAEIYEEAVSCPVCGDYVTHSPAVWEGKPLWWVVLGVIGTVAVIAALTVL